jgi:hypothetical protein
VRIERLCRISLRYTDASWHRPYGSGETGAEGVGFGRGDGTVTGEINGTVAWANYPRRREDGVWTPNLRGVITTGSGSDLLIAVHGQSVQEKDSGRRAILARVEFTTEAASHRWLNTCFVIAEGEIDEERDRWWLDAYVCLNEVAVGQPAIGVDPPDRFRQIGARNEHSRHEL